MTSYDDHVCGECFNDDGIQNFIVSRAVTNECSFCDAKSDQPIAAPIDDVVDHIKACIERLYEDPINSLTYDTEEDRYFGTTYTTQDLFEEIGLEFPNDSSGQLSEIVSDGLENSLWCQVNPYSLNAHERLQFSWEEFCRTIKHHRRYFFSVEMIERLMMNCIVLRRY